MKKSTLRRLSEIFLSAQLINQYSLNTYYIQDTKPVVKEDTRSLFDFISFHGILQWLPDALGGKKQILSLTLRPFVI